MAVFPSGSQARERAQGNNTLVQQIAIMEVAVLNAIAAGRFTATVSNLSTVTIQGTTITGSPMTDNDTDGENYYKVWQGTITDKVKLEQMGRKHGIELDRRLNKDKLVNELHKHMKSLNK